MSQPLYKLTAEHQAFAATLANSDLDEQTIADTMEGFSGDIEAKWKATICAAKTVDMMADQRENNAKESLATVKIERARADMLRQRVLDSMAACNRSKVDCVDFKLAIAQNPPALFIDDETSIPEKFWRTPPPMPEPSRYVDSAAVKAAIALGENVPGAHCQRGIRLSIKA